MGRWEEEDINKIMDNIDQTKCQVCGGLVDYHTPDACKRHLKMATKHTSRRPLLQGVCIGVIIISVIVGILIRL